jgi:hypothetical protein
MRVKCHVASDGCCWHLYQICVTYGQYAKEMSGSDMAVLVRNRGYIIRRICLILVSLLLVM